MEHGNPADRGRDTVTRGERAAQATDSVGEATLELFADASAYNDLLWHALRNLCPPQGRVLEVGCGIGNLTTLLLREPAVTGVHAIDPEPKYVDRLRNTLRDPRLDTSVCGIEQFRPPQDPAALDGSFDTVVSSNVLEHIEDDVGAVRNLRRLLRPGGHALLLVPAHRWLFSPIDRGLSHFRRYTTGDFRNLAVSSGLELVRARYFNPLAVLGWWVNGKVLRRSTLSAGQLRVYSRFLLGLTALLDRVNPFPLGISLLGHFCRPPEKEN